MKFLGSVLVLLLAATSAAGAAPSSNPAFLGIGMQDIAGACVITSITKCSPAEDAGLREDDVVMAIDGSPLVDIHAPVSARRSACDVLRARIMEHTPGDVASFDLRRFGKSTPVKVTLSTRADVQHRCFVGQSLPAIEAKDVDDRTREVDLHELRGRTTVLAWFRMNRCVGCASVIDKINDGVKARIADETPKVIGVTPYDEEQISPVVGGPTRIVRSITPFPTRAGFSSTVPLLAAQEDEFAQLTLQEADRVQFMVIDCRGIVRFVAPLAPGSEDLEAAIDEVLAAVEQAEHQRTRR